MLEKYLMRSFLQFYIEILDESSFLLVFDEHDIIPYYNSVLCICYTLASKSIRKML